MLRVLGSDEYAGAVRADEELAHSLGVSGVPFFAIDRRYGIAGAQPADSIAAALERCWAESGS